MSYGIIKAHHGIMKSTAQHDYDVVKNLLIDMGLPDKVIEPTGKHWHKIEDATAAMLKGMTHPEKYFNDGNLNRGLNYYLTLQPSPTLPGPPGVKFRI